MSTPQIGSGSYRGSSFVFCGYGAGHSPCFRARVLVLVTGIVLAAGPRGEAPGLVGPHPIVKTAGRLGISISSLSVPTLVRSGPAVKPGEATSLKVTT